jgi:hypothetical protein
VEFFTGELYHFLLNIIWYYFFYGSIIKIIDLIMLANRLRQVYEMQSQGGVAMGSGKIKKCSEYYKKGETTKKGKKVQFDDDRCKKYKYQPGVTKTTRTCAKKYTVGQLKKDGTLAKTRACEKWTISIPVVLEKGAQPVMLSLPASPLNLASLKGKKLTLKKPRQTSVKTGKKVKILVKKPRAKTTPKSLTVWNDFIAKKKAQSGMLQKDLFILYGKDGLRHSEYLAYKAQHSS